MKKVYIKPDCRTFALSTLQNVLVAHSPLHDLEYAESRERGDNRFEDYEDIDDDDFWDE